jgi:ATP-binding cassette, subfamily F, member 3
MVMESPHALFLDEPSNHLSLDAIEALLSAVQDFPGAVVWSLDKLVPENVYLVGDKQIENIGSVKSYNCKKSGLTVK